MSRDTTCCTYIDATSVCIEGLKGHPAITQPAVHSLQFIGNKLATNWGPLGDLQTALVVTATCTHVSYIGKSADSLK